MWNTILNWLKEFIVSGITTYIIPYATEWVLTVIIAGLVSVVVWLFTKLKLLTKPLPDTTETAVNTDIDDITVIYKAIINSSQANIKTLISNILADGKVSKDEITSFAEKLVATVVITDAQKAALEAEYGDIKALLVAWVKTALLAKIEAAIAKIGIKIDLDGDGDIADKKVSD